MTIKSSKLEQAINLWREYGFETRVFDAPKDASTFDKMLVIYSDVQNNKIRQVAFVNTATNRIVAEF